MLTFRILRSIIRLVISSHIVSGRFRNIIDGLIQESEISKPIGETSDRVEATKTVIGDRMLTCACDCIHPNCVKPAPLIKFSASLRKYLGMLHFSCLFYIYSD